ncbi:MAG: PD-(D/E)XK nuclease family protein [Planctomycetes bacterium]|nr:PD-(D/E)XK nuclease family protein [Planctomycetota bacterium]
MPNEDGVQELWQGAFDRVVLVKQQDRVVRAELVDWKSDHVPPHELAARTATYRPQLEAYRRILARLTQLDERAITARIAFLHAGSVVELDRTR